MSGETPPEAYLTLDVVAAMLGRSRRTIHRLMEAGVLQHVQNPLDRRRTLISQQSLDDHLTASANHPEQDSLHRTLADAFQRAATQIASQHERRNQDLQTMISDLLDHLEQHNQDLANQLTSLTGNPRQSSLGRALGTIAMAAAGFDEDPQELLFAINLVTKSLFPSYLHPSGPPDKFLTTHPVGRVIAEVRLGLEDPTAWITVNNLMDRTRLPRTFVENALRASATPRLFDPKSNTWLYPIAAVVDITAQFGSRTGTEP